jgi:PatG C-terminal
MSDQLLEQTPPRAQATLIPPDSSTCSSCGQSTTKGNQNISSFVYSIGKIGARFPNLSIEKEYAQVVARAETKGLTDRQTMQKILSSRENRYIARQICWVLSIGDVDSFFVTPRDSADLDLLIEALRSEPSALDIDVVIGVLGPVVPPSYCNGLQIPVVVFDQLYSFDQDSLLRSIPKQKEVEKDAFQNAASELLERIVQFANNDGTTDSNRALNYLVVRYPQIYSRVAEAFSRNFSLDSIIAQPSKLGGGRKLVDVIFTFVKRDNDFVEKVFVRVDVSDEFPFLTSRLSPYYDHK